MNIRRVPAKHFRQVLCELRPAVVRAYGGHWPADVACRNRVPGVPILVSVHDSHPDMLHDTVRYADMVLCVSALVQQQVLACGTDPSRVRRLPNRVDRTVFHQLTDRSGMADLDARFPPGRHLLHVGRKHRQKNLDTVIHALTSLPADYSAIFIGRGDTSPYVKLARQLNVSDRCYWIEAFNNSDMPRWYCWCDCLCMPSRWEGFGIVFIEAVACGTPVVTSDIAPMNEYLTHGKTAHLVAEYEDPQAVARAVRQVCEDGPYRQTLSAAAAEAALPFDRDRIEALEVAIYREALARTPRQLSRTERFALLFHRARQKVGSVRGKLRRAVSRVTDFFKKGTR
jgi:glycosyltransferase involved in cell wall biosynthesis